MIIKSVQIQNFRSIKDETLQCDKLTALVGANGSGKSSFLQALELFHSPVPKIEQDDYYNRDTTNEIIISITFDDLSQEAKTLFANYVQGNQLTVERVFKWENGKFSTKFHGALLENPDFNEIKRSSATDAKVKYEQIRAVKEYGDLPAWSSLAKTIDVLKKWEEKNPPKCRRQRDDGQFFGFSGVGQGYLGKFIRFLYVPAVRDASDDASERKGSILTELTNLVIRNSLAKQTAVIDFRKRTKEEYGKILDPKKLTELGDLSSKMTKTLQNFVPDATINLEWLSKEFDIPLPEAVVKLVEDGYQSSVVRTGHGLQRAFIMTMLQHLSQAKIENPINGENKTESTIVNLPNLVLIIEEPELYQHPNRQRHLAQILSKLSEGAIAGVSEKMQVIYSTHSPHFVGIDRIDQIRLLRKISYMSGLPKITKISSTNLDELAKKLTEKDTSANPTTYSREMLLPKLHALMTPWMNEGFFADVVVLVEGEGDRAAILGVARAKQHDLESKGFSIIPCFGKPNLDRPYVIFQSLRIPVYVIWDADKGTGNITENRNILNLLNQILEDWPNKITDNFACFENNLESTLINEIGSKEFNEYLNDCKKEFRITKKDTAIKNAVVISKILEKAHLNGRSSKSLESIVDMILLLKK